MPRPIQRLLPLVAIFLSFRVLWGGGRSSAPPPGRAEVAQTPGRARVKSVSSSSQVQLQGKIQLGGSETLNLITAGTCIIASYGGRSGAAQPRVCCVQRSVPQAVCVGVSVCGSDMFLLPVSLLCICLSAAHGSIPVSLDGAISGKSGNLVADDRVTLSEGEAASEFGVMWYQALSVPVRLA